MDPITHEFWAFSYVVGFFLKLISIYLNILALLNMCVLGDFWCKKGGKGVFVHISLRILFLQWQVFVPIFSKTGSHLSRVLDTLVFNFGPIIGSFC